MTVIINNHAEIVKIWVAKSPGDLNFPPPCFLHMQGKFIEWNEQEQKLVARFPIKSEFENPRQYMQGGFMVAALDNTLGPLSYLSGIASVTTQLNTSLVRPTTANYDYIDITANIIDQTSSKLYSTAQARSPLGKLLATVQATSHIV